ncbi:hypothetical protein JYJ95_37810 [Corallococcus exiguus]|uniref:hypothetical protein n=1 Tax=Corallococcus exiguus TaxID=83462 RepID=UPI001A8F892B|nr:hypothetical protein [Corallococcus exiguus]MBN8472293.1 hypothetical protein [Corallococcus exiguus]
MKSADVSGLPKDLEEIRRIALGEVPADEAQVRAALAQAWAWLAPLTSALLPAAPPPPAPREETCDCGTRNIACIHHAGFRAVQAAQQRGERRRRHHTPPPTVPPLSERLQYSLAKVGHEPTALATSAADALHPSGRCTCAGEGTCAWCRARCDACGSPYIPEAVRHALAQVWSALHVTTAHQGVAVAVLRAVYPELPVPNARAGADSRLTWDTLAHVTTEAVSLGAEDMRERAARLLETASIPLPFENWQGTKRELTAHFARALAVRIRDLPLPGEEVPRG